ncbi:hypothetical protein AAVH_15196, partial [Aphelenchoides avenae]
MWTGRASDFSVASISGASSGRHYSQQQRKFLLGNAGALSRGRIRRAPGSMLCSFQRYPNKQQLPDISSLGCGGFSSSKPISVCYAEP